MADAERRGFITAGTWCVDYNKIVTHWPSEDGHAEYLGGERFGGGSGCNFALDIKHLDQAMPVETIGIVGDDEDGHYLCSLADDAGISREQMHMVRNATTHFADAFVSKATRRRTHIYRGGVSDFLTPDHFDFGTTRARYLHLGLPGCHRQMDAPWADEPNGWVAVLKKARAARLLTNLELASVGAEVIIRLVSPCLPYLDCIIVNDFEIGALGGILPTVTDGRTDFDACEEAARNVLARGAMGIVVVHSPAMAVAVTREGEVFRKASVRIPDDLVAGTNGAGDAFAAGMLFGLHEGWSIEDCLSLAHATAAASLRSISTTASVESWQTCLALAQQWGWRQA